MGAYIFYRVMLFLVSMLGAGLGWCTVHVCSRAALPFCYWIVPSWLPSAVRPRQSSIEHASRMHRACMEQASRMRHTAHTLTSFIIMIIISPSACHATLHLQPVDRS